MLSKYWEIFFPSLCSIITVQIMTDFPNTFLVPLPTEWFHCGLLITLSIGSNQFWPMYLQNVCDAHGSCCFNLREVLRSWKKGRN